MRFQCGVEPLDRYFRTQASQEARKNVAAPFVLVAPEGDIAGYYTLSAASVKLGELPDTVAVPVLLSAARDSTERMAAAESSRHYAQALSRMGADHPDRLRVGLALGVQQRRAGELAAARATFEQVANEAQRRGDLVTRAEAVLGLQGAGHRMAEDPATLPMG